MTETQVTKTHGEPVQPFVIVGGILIDPLRVICAKETRGRTAISLDAMYGVQIVQIPMTLEKVHKALNSRPIRVPKRMMNRQIIEEEESQWQ